ncbi:MAG: beta-galactosidase, partial [Armatimonadia bacterium]
MNRFAVVLMVAASPCGSFAWAQDWYGPVDPHLAEVETDHQVRAEFVTPHTDWGSPWAPGKARVLFFVNGRGTAAREVTELTQRFDLEPQMVFWARLIDSTVDAWHGGEEGLQRIDRLLGEKWDAFVFLGIPVEKLSSEQQFKLLEQVANGAGLVLSGVDDKRVLKPSNQLKPLPTMLAAGPVGEAFKLRQGRGLRLPGQPKIDYAPGWEVTYDYWAQRLGRGILWAAGKEPQVHLTLEQREPEVQRSSLPSPEVTVRWKAPANCKGLGLQARLRREDGWEMALPRVAAGTAEGSAAVQVPVVRAGGYHLDVIARSAAGVENFASATFSVISPRQIGEVKLDQPWSEVGGKLSGKVSLSGPSGGADERLIVSLLDRRGRELARQIDSPVAAQGNFSFPVASWLPMLVTVRATLVQGTQEVSSGWAFANVTKRNRGQFNFLMWDMPTGTLAPYAEESLARQSVSLQLGSGVPARYVAAQDIAWVPYTTDISAKKDDHGVMKPMCWNDEAQVQAHVDGIVAKQVETSHHGVFAYSLGDEIAVRGSCLSPYCRAAYQRYLEQEYGKIEALNQSWGTQYRSFGEVELSKPDDDGESEAFRAGNFPRWFDRQAYQSYNFCKLCERFRDGFRRIDPQSICGFEGAGRFQDGDDLDGFVRSNTFWSPYPGTADEVLRSIAPRDFPRANWMGYTKEADSLLLQYWRMVTRGCDAVWWWRWECIGRYHGWLSPNLDPYPAVKEILKDTQVVREGLGDLLLKSEMLDDGVGLMFSQPSAYATRVQQSPSYGSYQGEHAAWHSTIRELGLNFRYFTDRQIRLGEAKLE